MLLFQKYSDFKLSWKWQRQHKRQRFASVNQLYVFLKVINKRKIYQHWNSKDKSSTTFCWMGFVWKKHLLYDVHSQIELRVFCSTRKFLEITGKAMIFWLRVAAFPIFLTGTHFCVTYIPQYRSCSDHSGNAAGHCMAPFGILTAECPFLIMCVAFDRVWYTAGIHAFPLSFINPLQN